MNFKWGLIWIFLNYSFLAPGLICVTDYCSLPLFHHATLLCKSYFVWRMHTVASCKLTHPCLVSGEYVFLIESCTVSCLEGFTPNCLRAQWALFIRSCLRLFDPIRFVFIHDQSKHRDRCNIWFLWYGDCWNPSCGSLGVHRLVFTSQTHLTTADRLTRTCLAGWQ